MKQEKETQQSFQKVLEEILYAARCPLKHRVMLEASLAVKQFSGALQDALPDSFKAVCANRHILIIG